MRATSPVLFCSTLLKRSHANQHSFFKRLLIVKIENATFYKQHPLSEDTSNSAWFPRLTFSLPSFPENPQYWSIVSPSSIGKTRFLEVLRGQHLCYPPTARSYPYLATEDVAAKDPQLRVPARALQYVGFNDKTGALGSSGTRGAYLSARYESRRESTDFSLLDYLNGHTSLNPSLDEMYREGDKEHQMVLNQVIEQLKLKSLLEMPVGNLSNGQTRRARIAKALMGRPEVILLDEPFMGLDPPTLSSISLLLYSLAEKSSPRVVLALRPQDTVPEWITHVVYLDSDTSVAQHGLKDAVLNVFSEKSQSTAPLASDGELGGPRGKYKKKSKSLNVLNEALVEMQGVEVKYGEKQVLGDWQQNVKGKSKRGLWWTVKRGERWGIFGPNGSGKTTIVSLICSDHPQTYSLPVKLFGRSRLPTLGQRGISIFDIQSRIGHSSPEVHAFFPRHLTIRQSLENAWADTLGGKAILAHENDVVVDACLRWFEAELNPTASNSGTSLNAVCLEERRTPGPYFRTAINQQMTEYLDRDIDWADRVRFGDVSISAQRVILMLRALIKKPDLLIIDEAFSGMDTHTRDKCMLFLAHGESLCINVQGGIARKSKTILAFNGKVSISGLEDCQALICISHLEDEVPASVTNWLCLPEPNEGKPVRFGRVDKSDKDKKWWDVIWGT